MELGHYDIEDLLLTAMKSEIESKELYSKIANKTQNGRIRVVDIDDTPLDFNTEKDKLDVHDRYRHLLTLSISLGRVET